MSDDYNRALGFVETAGLVFAIQAADVMAKAAEVEIIRAHKVDGLRVCVICRGDVAACQAAVEAGATLANSLGGLNGYNIIPSPADDSEILQNLLNSMKARKDAKKAARKARLRSFLQSQADPKPVESKVVEKSAEKHIENQPGKMSKKTKSDG